MTSKSLIIISSREQMLLKFSKSLSSEKYEILLISSESAGHIVFHYKGKKLFLKSNLATSNSGAGASSLKHLDQYEKYMKFANDTQFLTYKIFGLKNKDSDKLSRASFVYASQILGEKSFDKVFFLSPISDFVILAFAMISQSLKIAKFLQRTGVADKVFFSEDFLKRSIAFDNHKSYLGSEDKASKYSDCVWNNYSKHMNAKSLMILGGSSLQISGSNNAPSGNVTYEKIITPWKKLGQLKTGRPRLYYPLHCDPGKTTQPEAGIFQDQLLSLYIISELFGDIFSILVKEHPRQFDDLDSFNKYRGTKFYQTAASFKSVEFLSLFEHSHSALENCDAVVTANGTTGWEALKVGKPVVLFGEPWYSKAMGALRITDVIKDPSLLEKAIQEPMQISRSANSLEKHVRKNFYSFQMYDRVFEFVKSETFNENMLKELLKNEG